MSCNSCMRSYGFFCKETGCPNCGFSYCTKCLKMQIEVPRLGNKVQKVCLPCYDKLSKQKTQKENAHPIYQPNPTPGDPQNLLIDAPIPENEAIGLDDVLQKRLAALKTTQTTLQPDEEMAQRLANLKDVPYKVYDHKEILTAKETRSEQQQTDDLIQRFTDESQIDEVAEEALDPVKDIERRLAALKGVDVATVSSKQTLEDPPSEDEATIVKRIVKRAIEEAALPDFELTAEEKEFVNDVKPTKDQEELPWCTICNEDAVIRCKTCDGDLFCRSCFKEIHNDEEYREHTTEAYKAKPSETNF